VELWNTYLSYQQSTISHPVSALLDFIGSVAKVNQATCHAVLHSGFLDVLLCIYACNFISDIPKIDDVKGGRKALWEDVCATLVMLRHQPGAKAVISAHPVSVLWPNNNQSSRLKLGDQKSERQAIWRQLGRTMAMRRIYSLAQILRKPGDTKFLYPTESTDAGIDIAEFLRKVPS
jgi:hypothetical protein